MHLHDKKIKLKLSISLDGTKKMSGVLKSATDENIELELLEPPMGVVSIRFSAIDRARLVPEFN